MNNFVCAPDPENILHWYFVIWGFGGNFRGGYYFGLITCPNDYPRQPPSIQILIENGHFCKTYEIYVSMFDTHPDGWNPEWTVQNLIEGLVKFWCDPESHSSV